jgi:hypothetical protein
MRSKSWLPDHLEPSRVVEGRLDVVDRAGADDEEQPVILAGKHVADLAPGRGDALGLVGVKGELLHQDGRGNERPEVFDADVVRGKQHGSG